MEEKIKLDYNIIKNNFLNKISVLEDSKLKTFLTKICTNSFEDIYFMEKQKREIKKLRKENLSLKIQNLIEKEENKTLKEMIKKPPHKLKLRVRKKSNQKEKEKEKVKVKVKKIQGKKRNRKKL